MSTKFDNELKLIYNPFAKDFAKYCVDHIHPKFFEEAASTTGKYHPQYALGKGGLYRHTCAAVQIADSLLSVESVMNNIVLFGHNDVYSRDVVILALIMHDSCKCGKNWDSKYTRHDHSIQARDFVLDLANKMCEEDKIEAKGFVKEFAENVGKCIESHMGQWTTCKWDSTVLPKPEAPIQIFVHVCDYLASRKFLLWDYDKELYDPDSPLTQGEY